VPRLWAYSCQLLKSSQNRLGVSGVESELDSDEFVYQEKEDSDIDEEITSDDIGLNYIRLMLSTHLSLSGVSHN